FGGGSGVSSNRRFRLYSSRAMRFIVNVGKSLVHHPDTETLSISLLLRGSVSPVVKETCATRISQLTAGRRRCGCDSRRARVAHKARTGAAPRRMVDARWAA